MDPDVQLNCVPLTQCHLVDVHQLAVSHDAVLSTVHSISHRDDQRHDPAGREEISGVEPGV